MFPNVIEERSLRDKENVFIDRIHAGKILSEKLEKYKDSPETRILAIPAGGVPVGFAIAEELHLRLDVVVVRKIQVPWDPEAGFGAVSWNGDVFLNTFLVERLGLTKELIDEATLKTKEIVKDRLAKFRSKIPLDLSEKIVILVDDGLASGFTMLAAARSVRKEDPKKLLIAIPTASDSAIQILSPEVDYLICLNKRSSGFFAVADAYSKWHDLSDDEVIYFIEKARHPE